MIERELVCIMLCTTCFCVDYSEFFSGIGNVWGAIDKFLEKRNLIGGTGPKSVENEIKEAKSIIAGLTSKL